MCLGMSWKGGMHWDKRARYVPFFFFSFPSFIVATSHLLWLEISARFILPDHIICEVWGVLNRALLVLA